MSQSDKQEHPPEDDRKKTNLSDYLTAPKRKRKSYVVTAFSPAVPSEVDDRLLALIGSANKNLSVAASTSTDDLIRNLRRHVVLLLYDDEFMALEPGLNLIKTMKQHTKTSAPVLFFTRRPQVLVEAYHKILLAFHEADDYLDYSRMSTAQIMSRVRTGIITKNRRRSRRYKVDLPIEYFDEKSRFQPEFDPPDIPGLVLRYDHVSDQDVEIPPHPLELPVQGYPGRLIDLSMHGTLIAGSNERIFRLGEQIKIKIKLEAHKSVDSSEFLHLSAKVQRVLISGNTAACSFECLTLSQSDKLLKFLTEIVNEQNMQPASQFNSQFPVAK